jgi:hypothetical protein
MSENAMHKSLEELSVRLARVEGKLDNGIGSRLKFVEKMQWWQIGILVVIIGGLVGGMWTMLRVGSATTRENQRLLLEHIRNSSPGIEKSVEP